jgi:hypothetical protein
MARCKPTLKYRADTAAVQIGKAFNGLYRVCFCFDNKSGYAVLYDFGN